MVLKTLLGGMKDGALAHSLKGFLNERFQSFGEVTDCELDTKAARIVIHARLLGEREVITAAIERYEIVDTDEGRMFVPQKFSSSREWIARLLVKLFSGKRYKLPGAVSALL